MTTRSLKQLTVLAALAVLFTLGCGKKKEEDKAKKEAEARKGVTEARYDEARPGEARPGEARPGEARPGEARPGEARPGEASPDEARPAEARPDEARPDEARPADARLATGQVQAQQILIAWKGSGEGIKASRTKEQAKTLAENVAKQAAKGDFCSLVKKYSDGSKDDCGKLMPMKESEAIDMFKPLFKLNVGGVTQVVTGPDGYYILKRIK